MFKQTSRITKLENLETQENGTFHIIKSWEAPERRDITYYVDKLTRGMIMALTEE